MLRFFAISAAFSAVLVSLIVHYSGPSSYPLTNFSEPGFSADRIPDLSGKVVIVTGANSGLGRASALELYRKNAHVILACRSVARGEEAASGIKREVGSSGKGKLEVMALDLNILKSVKAFADVFKAKKLPLHILMLNAGVMTPPYALTKDGIESQFGVNHVAHHFLATQLLDVLEASKPSRVVVVSAELYRLAPAEGVRLTLSEINDENIYSPLSAYAQSKLANICFSRALAKRVQGSQIFVNAIHPGFVSTDLSRHIKSALPKFLQPAAEWIIPRLAYRPDTAVLTQLFAAVSEDIVRENFTGKYFVPIAREEGEFEHPALLDPTLDDRLWDFTERIIKEKIPQADS